MRAVILPALAAIALTPQPATAAVTTTETVPVPFAEMLTEFRQICVGNLTSKEGFQTAAKASAWQFAADPSGTPMDEIVPNGRWASAKAKVSAAHGEVQIEGIPPFQCTFTAQLDTIPDPAAMLSTAELALGLTGGKLKVGKRLTEIVWEPPVAAGELKRRIFVQIGEFQESKQAVRLTVMQLAGKK